MRTAVIGGGAWGTALAALLAQKGESVVLWAREPELVSEMRRNRENAWYLSGAKLPEALEFTADPAQALGGADIVLFAVPSQHFRGMLNSLNRHIPKRCALVCASKGVEVKRLATMSEVVADELKETKPTFAMLSGPSFAKEVALGLPTAVTLGCADKKVATMVQGVFSSEYFRVYTTSDVRGVELGGAVKNVVAIAAGVADGLGFGLNARAALITRGLAEMSRLGRAMGAKEKTFMGLSGLGDLVLTCTGDASRNRQVGLNLAKGRPLTEILAEMKSVAEGVKTTEAVAALGVKYKVELPITAMVKAILYEDKDPRIAVRELMTRELKEE